MAWDVWCYVAQLGRCKRLPGEKFFSPGDEICRMRERKAVFDIDEEELLHQSVPVFNCHIPGCTTTFTCILDYELHYNSLHRHVCGQCHKRLPSAHLLDLHVLETHDALFSLMAKKEAMYRCLLEGCQEKFTSPVLRREHCISAHKFPADFRFGEVKKKFKKKPEKGEKFAGTKEAPAHGETQEDHMEDIVAMETGNNPTCDLDLHKTCQHVDEAASHQLAPRRQFAYSVPKNICFGQGVARGFQRSGAGRTGGRSRGGRKKKDWHQMNKSNDMDTTTNIETSDLSELQVVLMEEAS